MPLSSKPISMSHITLPDAKCQKEMKDSSWPKQWESLTWEIPQEQAKPTVHIEKELETYQVAHWPLNCTATQLPWQQWDFHPVLWHGLSSKEGTPFLKTDSDWHSSFPTQLTVLKTCSVFLGLRPGSPPCGSLCGLPESSWSSALRSF